MGQPVTATFSASTQIVGGPFGLGGVPEIADTPQSTPPNTNAPGPDEWQLQIGLNFRVMPSGFTLNRVQLLPPAGSTNAKSFATATGVVSLSGWTVGSCVVPAVAGGTIYVISSAVETLALAYS